MSPTKPVDVNVDKVTKVHAASKEIHRKVLSARILATRCQARTVLGEDYQALRDVCIDLPTRGRIPRSMILKASLRKIQTLQEEVRRLQQMSGGQSQQVELPGSAGTGRQINSQTCSIPGLCKFHPNQGRRLSAQSRGGNTT